MKIALNDSRFNSGVKELKARCIVSRLATLLQWV